MHTRTIAIVVLGLFLSALSFPSASIGQVMNASWYGPGFHGKKMANGNRFNMYAYTVAHKTLPLNSCVYVISLVNGKKVRALVTDRGPYVKGRQVDLSYAVAKVAGIIPKGTGKVNVIRC